MTLRDEILQSIEENKKAKSYMHKVDVYTICILIACILLATTFL
jgi:predicted membrane channel-forming protein YqfA (hemolysin III family)